GQAAALPHGGVGGLHKGVMIFGGAVAANRADDQAVGRNIQFAPQRLAANVGIAKGVQVVAVVNDLHAVAVIAGLGMDFERGLRHADDAPGQVVGGDGADLAHGPLQACAAGLEVGIAYAPQDVFDAQAAASQAA